MDQELYEFAERLANRLAVYTGPITGEVIADTIKEVLDIMEENASDDIDTDDIDDLWE